MTAPVPLRDQIAFKLHDMECHYPCDPSHMAKQFQQADAIMEIVSESRARALRDAADAFPKAGFPGTCQGWVMTWLRARAERGEA